MNKALAYIYLIWMIGVLIAGIIIMNSIVSDDPGSLKLRFERLEEVTDENY